MLEQIESLLADHGVVLDRRTRSPVEARIPDDEYWPILSDPGVILTTSAQSDKPDIDRKDLNQMV